MNNDRIPAYALQLGDIVGSGEKVAQTYAGVRTPRGKIHVVLDGPKGRRVALWGKFTIVGARRAGEQSNV